MIRTPRFTTLTAFAAGAALLASLTGCAAPTSDADGSDGSAVPGEVSVVTSFTIIADMVRVIGGDDVAVHNLVPTGTDPHEYEPLPEDVKAASTADLVLANGLNLEGGSDGWFARLMDSVGQPDEHVVEVSGDVTPMMLGEGSADEEINPHGFVDPNNGILMAEAVQDALMTADPANAAEYEARGDAYLEELRGIEAEYEERIGEIPDEDRMLVTSERAFQYLAARYDLNEGFIWEIDTEENGSAEQLTALISTLRKHPVAHLIVESNVDRRPMETVSQESGIPIFERPIYSDEIGTPDDEVNTYVKYLHYNLDVITDALGDE